MSELSVGVMVSHMLAVGETAYSNYEFITPDHLFSGLTKLQDALDPRLLFKLGLPPPAVPGFQAEAGQLLQLFEEFKLDPRQARHKMRELVGDGSYPRSEAGSISRSSESRQAFERAAEIAQEKEAPQTAVQHLLAALLEIEEGHIRPLLEEMAVDLDGLHKAALALPLPQVEISPTPYLDQYGQDLVQLAREGMISEVFGRKDEMLQIIRTLARDAKNNPVLIGEAGVGKTAIVEGIAYRIATGNIPPDFQDKRIIQINAGDLVADTKYRGEFEERMQHIIAEATDAEEVILFIDEVHLLVGAGSGSGTMDAANILKPALAKGKLKLIGATTNAEYRRYIEKDRALERRFRPIRVEEPDTETTREILVGVRERLQKKRNVQILDEAIEAAIRFSVRYLPDHRLPDKAIDLLDDACSWVQYGNISFHPDFDEPEGTDMLVTADTIREVVADKIGVPVAQLSEDEKQRILKMADVLRKTIVGQDEAIEAITTAVKRWFANLYPTKRPVGVFLFVGPTGVGKTALAKATARFLFASEERIIRLDMSEYSQKQNLARLIGAPPGYAGYEEGGQLTEALRKAPYTVVLLDEVEKAHAEVLHSFLSVFGEGRMTDGQGRTIDASHALFIMTSNLGYTNLQSDSPDSSPQPQVSASQPAQPTREMIQRAVYNHFRPEFLNRIDDIVYFQPIEPEHMPEIVRIQLKQLTATLAEREIGLEVKDEVVRWLAQRGYDPQLGARPLVRLINKELLNEIGGLILTGKLKPTHTIHVSLKEDMLRFDLIGFPTE
jgi:ATP-dependent Clp protease ATP-binding subunit ClpC